MTKLKHKALIIYSLLLIFGALIMPSSLAYAGNICGDGSQGSKVTTAIDLGCVGKGNPISDMTFGIIRFLSAGVGIVIVGSTVLAGIQYTASAGDPKAIAKARGRIGSNLVALILFIFSYALINYLTPGGFLN